MVKCVVKRRFRYAHDGYNSRLLAVGEEAEIRPEVVLGLIEAGFVSEWYDEKAGPANLPGDEEGESQSGGEKLEGKDRQAKRAVVIPNNWKDATWQQRRHLASLISDDPIKNDREAVAAIEGELDIREVEELLR